MDCVHLLEWKNDENAYERVGENPLITAIRLQKPDHVIALFKPMGLKKKQADPLRHKPGLDVTPLTMAMNRKGGSSDLVALVVEEIRDRKLENERMWMKLKQFDQMKLVQYIAQMAMRYGFNKLLG